MWIASMARIGGPARNWTDLALGCQNGNTPGKGDTYVAVLDRALQKIEELIVKK
jgi:hypothetical protein